MDERIKITTVEYPSVIRRITYIATDGTKFNSAFDAEAHQRYLDNVDKISKLEKYGDYYLCRSIEDVMTVWFEYRGYDDDNPPGIIEVFLPFFLRFKVDDETLKYTVEFFNKDNLLDMLDMLSN